VQVPGQYWWYMYRSATMLSVCIAQVHWCTWLPLSGLCGAAYLWIDLCRKEICSRCCDTHRICTCETEAMPMLSTNNFSGSSLNCRLSSSTLWICSSGRQWRPRHHKFFHHGPFGEHQEGHQMRFFTFVYEKDICNNEYCSPDVTSPQKIHTVSKWSGLWTSVLGCAHT
jgi:hypothetical protein